jgi:hypothetical protein
MRTFERTYFDVKVTHANADSNIDKPPDKLLSDNYKEKKRKYDPRVINVKKLPTCLWSSQHLGVLPRYVRNTTNV